MDDLILVLKAASKVAYVKRATLFKALIIPMVVYFLLIYSGQWMTDYIHADSAVVDAQKNTVLEMAGASILPLLLSWWLSGLVNIVMIIRIHRIILVKHISKNADTNFLIFVKFLVKTICLSLWGVIFLAPVFGVWGVEGVGLSLALLGAVLWALLGCYLISMASLVFPATAVGSAISFLRSMQLASQHKALMIGVVVGVPLVFFIASMSLNYVPLPNFLSHLFFVLETVAFLIIEVSCLSIAYHVINARLGAVND